DGMGDYERFDRDAADKGNGQMFVEITPITFSVRVRVGDSVNQLRLFLGSPEGVEIGSPELYRTCLRAENPFLSVDLSPAVIGRLPASAFATSSDETSAPIDLGSGSLEIPWSYRTPAATGVFWSGMRSTG